MKKFDISFETNADILEINKMLKNFEEVGNHLMQKIKILEVKEHTLEIPMFEGTREKLEEFILDYSDMGLGELPKLPPNLDVLWCYNNGLETLPELPPNLSRLWCYNNQLETLPELPSSLRELYSRGNNFSYKERQRIIDLRPDNATRWEV